MKLTHLITISLIICLFGTNRAQDVWLSISDVGAERIRIAVMPFFPRVESPTEEDLEMGRKISEIIYDDLAFSPFFTLLESQFFPQTIQDEDDIAPFQWVSMGIQAIVLGSFKVSGAKLKVDARLFSVSSSKRMYRRKLEEKPAQLRRIAHAISDDVVKALTGEEGIAQTQIAFISNRTGHKELYICDYDGYYSNRITYTNSLIFTPDWSPDGFQVSFTSYSSGNANLYAYDILSREQTILSDLPGLNVAGAWSPDGRRLAFVSTRDGNSEIYVMDVRTKSLKRITFNDAIDTSPSWSPNGRNIAFCSDRSGTPQIYIMDEEGGNVHRLTFEGSFNDQPSWSPRGDIIAFASRTRGQFDIAIIDPTGGNLTYLTSIGNNEHPDWAPDGYHIVFCSDRLGRYQLYAMLWDGTQIRRITNSISDNISPAWSSRYRWDFD
mgnify:CR=1 FL=1